MPKVATRWDSGATGESNPGPRVRIPSALTTKPSSHPHLVAAERQVGGTEEELEPRRAAVLQQWSERAELVLGVRLRLHVTDDVQRRRRGPVIAKHPTTHRHSHRLTLPHLETSNTVPY